VARRIIPGRHAPAYPRQHKRVEICAERSRPGRCGEGSRPRDPLWPEPSAFAYQGTKLRPEVRDRLRGAPGTRALPALAGTTPQGTYLCSSGDAPAGRTLRSSTSVGLSSSMLPADLNFPSRHRILTSSHRPQPWHDRSHRAPNRSPRHLCRAVA
jgi:hypothetical protein